MNGTNLALFGIVFQTEKKCKRSSTAVMLCLGGCENLQCTSLNELCEGMIAFVAYEVAMPLSQ